MTIQRTLLLPLLLGVAACSAVEVPTNASAVTSDAQKAAENLNAGVKSEAKRENVLILFFDDMRFDSFSYRGGPVPTPNIDALAAESTRFDMAMTTTGLCSPSRAALFTGRWGHRTGLDDNVELWHSRLSELDPEEGGIIKRASDSGYFVGYVGKWHLGAKGPQIRGAEFVESFEADTHAAVRPYTPYGGLERNNRYQAGERDKNGDKLDYFQTLDGTYEDTPTYDKVKNGKRMFAKAANDDRPFFGVVSFSQPHPPYRVPEPYASMFDPATVDVPENHLSERVNKPIAQDYPFWPWHDVSHLTEKDWREMRAHYYGAIAMIDQAVGELIESAKEQGIYDDLHIVLLGDQGSMLGEHRLYDKAAYAYDELMRIPLLVRDPDIAPRIVKRHVSLMDVPATLSDWMQLPPDGAEDGTSLEPLMVEGDSAISDAEDSALYAYEWYNGAWFGVRAIRTPEYKYVFNPADSRDELYDLKADPVELNNRINDKALADVRDDLRERLLEKLQRVEDPAAEKLALDIKRNPNRR